MWLEEAIFVLKVINIVQENAFCAFPDTYIEKILNEKKRLKIDNLPVVHEGK